MSSANEFQRFASGLRDRCWDVVGQCRSVDVVKMTIQTQGQEAATITMLKMGR